MRAEFELSGARSMYRVQAEVASFDEREIRLLMAGGRAISVPIKALVKINALSSPSSEGTGLAALSSRSRSQGDIARELRRTLEGLDDEQRAIARVRLLRGQLEIVRGGVSSTLNRSLVRDLLEVATAVEEQMTYADHVSAKGPGRYAADAIRQASRRPRQTSSNALTVVLQAALQRLIAEHEDYRRKVSTKVEHPPMIVTGDRVNVTRGSDHEFDLPIRITLDQLAPELSDVTVVLDKYRNLGLIGRAEMIRQLIGGQKTTLTVRLRDNRKQGARSDIRIDAHLRYVTPDGQVRTTPRQTLLLSIQGNEARTEIPNPYRPYAGGLPVSQPEMFFGRDGLIHDLVRDLGKTPGGMCFALYGQQRTGKSSVLEQVKKRLLDKRAIVASLSMGIIDRHSMTVDFVEEILDQFRVQIDRALPAETSRLLLDRWPDTAAIASRPLRSFQRALEAGRSVLRSTGSSGIAFVVVVDEFTYIHEILRRRGIDPSEHNELKDFMRQLKGLLESRLFSALLIGQDTMPRFLESYPNEFSVMSTRKLDYLTIDEAQNLADLPIRTPVGSSRYTGYALSTIASYTGGHPFFTQILCDRVITLVNSHNRSEVTQSDVEEAVESLLSGRDRIEAHKFDCLITADNTHTLVSEVEGEEESDGTERSQTVLRRIANLSGSQNSPVPIENLQLDARQNQALDDLLLRGVLHFNENGVSIRVLLYADYLRRHQR